MLKERLSTIFRSIENGNNLGEQITLVGATKTIDYTTINQAINYGLKVVAENKVQEFREKTDFIVGASQHFIGHLQTNKVKYLVGKVDLIHSVDTIKLATEISKQANKLNVVQKVLLEVNIGGEQTKSGFTPEEIESALVEISTLENLKVQGLMTMLPPSNDQVYLAQLFRKMRAIYDGLKEKGYNLTYLSMGMSNDYKLAIQNGSNMIRIGSGIFGPRNYLK